MCGNLAKGLKHIPMVCFVQSCNSSTYSTYSSAWQSQSLVNFWWNEFTKEYFKITSDRGEAFLSMPQNPEGLKAKVNSAIEKIYKWLYEGKGTKLNQKTNILEGNICDSYHKRYLSLIFKEIQNIKKKANDPVEKQANDMKKQFPE